jgi:hypothetical protein
MLIGCGLRRGELLSLCVDSIQSREERWVIADLLGKAGHIRTVPIPSWVRTGVEKWMDASGITNGALFRSIDRRGRVWGTGMTPKVLWEIVKAAHLRPAVPPCRRRTGPDSIPARTRLHPDDGAVSGLQAQATLRSQRQDGTRALSEPPDSRGGLLVPSRLPAGNHRPIIGGSTPHESRAEQLLDRATNHRRGNSARTALNPRPPLPLMQIPTGFETRRSGRPHKGLPQDDGSFSGCRVRFCYRSHA